MMARQLSAPSPRSRPSGHHTGIAIVGDPRATTPGAPISALPGIGSDDPGVDEQLRESELPPPVPSTAIFSKEDGVVAWQNCIEPEDAFTDNIRVYGSHCGLGVNPVVLYAG